jgi:RNA polymerase sigma factor (sigma-70 family)
MRPVRVIKAFPKHDTKLDDMSNETDPNPMNSDRELLQRFVAGEDQVALEALVRRHSTLVMGVCRRILGNVHDAEDVFQATFMVLAKSARSIRKRRSLGSWLYGVAYRLALRARRKRRREREEPFMETASCEDSPFDQIARRHDEQIVDEELQRLPDAYRRPLVLQYLSSRTNKEIALELGLSVTAVEGRLKRGRDKLRHRLHRRGISGAAFVAAIGLSQQLAEAGVHQRLLSETVELCVSLSAGNIPADSFPSQLAQSEITQMASTAKNLVSLTTAVLISTCLGLYGIANLVTGQEPAKSPQRQAIYVTPAVQPRQATAPIDGQLVITTDGQENLIRQAIDTIETALRSKMTNVQFSGATLNEVATHFAKELQIPIVIDHKALQDFGIGAEEIDIDLQTNGISARSALRLILTPLDLCYVLKNEVLLITTDAAAETMLDTRVYATADQAIENLVDLIVSAVAPDTWEDVGGPGMIREVPNVGIVVSTTQACHEEIWDLLHQLKQATSAKRRNRN